MVGLELAINFKVNTLVSQKEKAMKIMNMKQENQDQEWSLYSNIVIGSLYHR